MMTHQVRYKCYFLLHLLDNVVARDCFSEFDGWIVNWRKRFWLYHSSKRGSANDPGGFVFRGGEDGTAQAYLGRAMVLF
ncbi:hypothetical protein CUMW_156070 [Citrus unshiu]|uniref:Uncharacterized protein n=1 Tax=Citrus unshiu TaxID=55188 RepID=A0A2H5PPQ8_CITUN|nr:hypothetical protein CUMW_156070 [Citrus unshiu]